MHSRDAFASSPTGARCNHTTTFPAFCVRLPLTRRIPIAGRGSGSGNRMCCAYPLRWRTGKILDATRRRLRMHDVTRYRAFAGFALYRACLLHATTSLGRIRPLRLAAQAWLLFLLKFPGRMKPGSGIRYAWTKRRCAMRHRRDAFLSTGCLLFPLY